MRHAIIALLLALAGTAVAAPIPPVGCPNCILNTASPQNAEINIGTATIRGTLSVTTLTAVNFAITNLNVTTIVGSGAGLTNLNASQLLSGTVPSARMSGAYAGITGVGTIASGVWNGSPVATQYGGTGKNWSAVNRGALPFFDATGSMSTLAPDTANKLLQTNGAGADPIWTAAPTVLGTNVTAIPLANLQTGNLPAAIKATDASLVTVSGSKVTGNISGNAGNITGTLPLAQLGAGTLAADIIAQTLDNIGTPVGTFGGPTLAAQVTTNNQGRVTNITQVAIPGVSTRTAFVDVDNNWHGPSQHSQSSWTFHNTSGISVFGPVTATNFIGSGAGLMNLQPYAIAAGTLPANVIASSIAINSVGTGQIVNNSVTNAKIAAGTFSNITIPAANVADGTLSTGVIARVGQFLDSGTTIQNTVDPTKTLQFDLSTQLSGAGLTIAPQMWSNKTLYIPNNLTSSSGNFIIQDADGRVYIGTNTAIGGSNSGIQYSNLIANRAQLRMNAFGNHAGVSGMTCAKSRGTTIGDNQSLQVGDPECRITVQGAAATAGSLPINADMTFQANSIQSLTVATDWNVRLMNKSGSLGTRFYLTSEGALGLNEGTTPGAALDVASISASSVAAIIKGASSQSADLLDVRNSAGTNLVTIDSSGNLTGVSSITASAFFGNGAALTGIPTTSDLTSIGIATAALQASKVDRAGDTMTGQLTNTSSITVVNATGNGFRVLFSPDGSNSTLTPGIVAIQNFAATPGFRFSRVNGTQTSSTPVVAANIIGQAGFRGYDGITAATNRATIDAYAEKNFSSTNTGTNLQFLTQVNDNSAAAGLRARMVITSTGIIVIGNNASATTGLANAPTAQLQITPSPGFAAIYSTGSFISGSSVNASAFFGDGANLTAITAANISAGTLGPAVIASSVAATAVTAGSYGSASSVTTFTVGGDGRLTAASNTSIQITESQVTSLTTDLAAKASTGTNSDITSLTALASITSAMSVSTINSNGSFTSTGTMNLYSATGGSGFAVYTTSASGASLKIDPRGVSASGGGAQIMRYEGFGAGFSNTLYMQRSNGTSTSSSPALSGDGGYGLFWGYNDGTVNGQTVSRSQITSVAEKDQSLNNNRSNIQMVTTGGPGTANTREVRFVITSTGVVVIGRLQSVPQTALADAPTAQLHIIPDVRMGANFAALFSTGSFISRSSITASAFFGDGSNLTGIASSSTTIAFSSAAFTAQTFTNNDFSPGCNVAGSTLTWTSTGRVAYVTYSGASRKSGAGGNHFSQVWIDGATKVLGPTGRLYNSSTGGVLTYDGYDATLKTSAGVHTICMGVYINADTLTFCGDGNVCEFSITEP